VKERRGGHIGTISGLALLTGATALAAVAGGRHSIFATLLLGLLSLGMAHSLYVEILRQARRRAPWNRHDTVNTVVLAAFGEVSLLVTLIAPNPEPVRAVGPILSLAYAATCALFITERRRATNRQPANQHAKATEQVTNHAKATDANPASGRQDHDHRGHEDTRRVDRQLGGGEPVEAERLRPKPVVGAQAGLAVGDGHREH
jgi:hypothetical protein